MNIEELKRGTQIWVRGFSDGMGNIDFLDRYRDIEELDCLIKDEIAKMDESDFRLDVPDIDQPKPAVPKFVADWIEYCKKRGLTLKGLFSNSDMPAKIFDWIFCSDENCRLMAEAWINGYIVKKEKLYTVDLPNGQPLVRGINTLYFSQNLAAENVKLTEKEIRKDFDWAWQFAKEVTDN